MTTLEQAFAAWGTHDRDEPFSLFAEVRERGAVHEVTLADGHDAWLVVKFAECRAALSDPRLSKDLRAALASGDEVVAEGLPGPAFARHMLVVDPPDHTRLRRLVAGAFSVRRIEGLRLRVQHIIDELLDAVAARGPDTVVDLVASFAFPLPFTVICELLGVPIVERAALGRGLTALAAPTATPAQYAAAKQASDAVVEQLTTLVRTKANDPDDDLISALIGARDGAERLSQQELLSTIFQLIIVGHDTTASLIENSVVALLRHPDQLGDLRSDPATISTALEEFLRYDAPVPHATFRYARETLDLGGATIPAGAQVIVNLASANRDADRFENPDEARSSPCGRAAPRLRARDPLLSGCPPRSDGRSAGAHLAPQPVPGAAPRGGARAAALGTRRRPRAPRSHGAPGHPGARPLVERAFCAVG